MINPVFVMVKNIFFMNLLLLASALKFSIYANVNSPNIAFFQKNGNVSGKVTDDVGPVIGANVSVVGTTNGTITDGEGRFVLRNVKEGDFIQISFIGYITQKIKFIGQSAIEVKLALDFQKLNEVVVVGFGTQKKVNLTGAVSTVNAENLESRPVQNALQSLQGIVPGLQISTNSGMLDKKMDINIRGIGTIGEGSIGGPLVLIDGMEGDINSVNPQDIENVSVLKDAAASSIYGSRAPFGVILVTTKAGKNGQLSVNYNNSFRWSSPVKMPKQMDSYTFAIYFNDASINAGGSGYFSPEHLQRIKNYQEGKLKDPLGLRPGNEVLWADGYEQGCANTNWYDVIYKDWAFAQEHNISINGGADKINYFVSMNYLDQNGFMEFNQDVYKRLTATAKINFKLADWVKFNCSHRFTRENFERPSDLTDGLFYDLARQGWPTLPVYDVNGYMYSSPSPVLGLRDGGDRKSVV